jgi:hypothetical protein
MPGVPDPSKKLTGLNLIELDDATDARATTFAPKSEALTAHVTG